MSKHDKSNSHKEKTVEETYKKKELREHIYTIPDMWIGGIEKDTIPMWIYNDETNKIVFNDITFVPGFYKLFDEALVNARDHQVENKACNLIKVNVNKEEGWISVMNNGSGIPVAMHSEYKMWVPEFIFGELMTSSNYDRKGKTTGGKNGVGIKVVNIFSKKFIIETVCTKNKKKYTQEFRDNMTVKDKPIIKDIGKEDKAYTKVTYYPDYERFSMKGLSNDIVHLMKKRTYDMSACTRPDVKVYFNDELVKVKKFQDFIKLHYDKEPNMVYEEVNDRWKVGIVFNPDAGGNQVSLVNGIWTYKGGTHVDYVMKQVIKKVQDHVEKQVKNLKVKPLQIQEHLDIFVDSVINDPQFKSQTKEELVTKVSEFGSKCDIDNLFMKKLFETTKLIDLVIKNAQFKEMTALKKTDGKKVSNIRDIEKLEDAKWAGTTKSKQTRLILTEGDSAKSYALSGIAVVGNERFGVFPLRGKLPNARKAKPQELLKNKELTNLKKILGLKQGAIYADIGKLRYGGIIILTDQDSVVGDTPLLLLDEENMIDIRRIDELCYEWIEHDGKEVSLADYKVWTEKGWTKVVKVIRHQVTKNIYRVITSTGIVDVTEDHSLLREDGTKISPKECSIGQTLLHSFPNFNKEPTTYSQEYIEYDSIKHSRKIPKDILNAPFEVRDSFCEQYMDHWFDKEECFVTDDKVEAQKFFFLCSSGKFMPSIEYQKNKYILHFGRGCDEKDNEILNIIDLGNSTQYVYDLETENHHFQAGIGQMIVHNTDGDHIKGLIINLFNTFWPELVAMEGFIQTISTPLLKAFKKTDKKKKNPKVFFNMVEYENWVKNELKGDLTGWEIKYYKGLGTSKENEAAEIFAELETRIISFTWEPNKSGSKKGSKNDEPKKGSKKEASESESDGEPEDSPKKGSKKSKDEDEGEEDVNSRLERKLEEKRNDVIYNSQSYDAITLAFDEARVNDRKNWLAKYDKNNIIDFTKQKISYSEFINKGLIHFSNYDNIRSIPSIVDGLKPSQRKILHMCFKNDQKTEIKVAQLAADVAKHTAYKHGEKSLEEAIVCMAQNFVGSNNINLLFPSGNFGHRKQGGKEAAQSRYIFTRLETIVSKIFRKEDFSILNYLEDEGDIVEPEYFLPIIPMVLVNGASGIGTGFSTTIPNYNPLDIAENILRLMENKTIKKMIPHYYGFKGKIESISESQFKVSGVYKITDENTVRISELPIAGNLCWIEKYEDFLKKELPDAVKKDKKGNKKESKSKIINYHSDSTNNKVDFKVIFKGSELQKLVKKKQASEQDEIEKQLKLSSKISTTNMYLYNEKHNITKYESPEDILTNFYEFRLSKYEIRRKHHLKMLNNELKILEYKVKFINDVIEDRIIIKKKKQEEIIEKLVKRSYPKMSYDLEATEEEKSYKYLTAMALFSLTKEKIEELNKEYEAKKTEYDDYNSTTSLELWKREIDEFIKHYKEWLVERQEEELVVKLKPKKDTTKTKSKSK